ncbi:MAG: hypothetical protein GXY93_11355 [Hungateiclostridium saccincola]|nr:hypothetical protein [Acetivibrio saccincola]
MHQMSKKSGYTEAYNEIFERAGMSLQDDVNIVYLEKHKGAHTKVYKQYVLDYLTGATEGLTGEEAKTALTRTLNELKNQLLQNPRMPYKGGL